MGQQEVYNILNKATRSLTMKEISERASNPNIKTISRILKAMERYKEVSIFKGDMSFQITINGKSYTRIRAIRFFKLNRKKKKVI